MKWMSQVLISFAALLAVTSAHAVDRDALIKQLEAKYADVGSMQADFTQTVKSELFGEETQSGQLKVKRPKMMRWSFGDDKLFVTDGTTMWIYTKADQQVIRYDDISGSSSATDSLLQSLDKLDELFDVKLLASSDEGHELELAPKNVEDSQFKMVKLVLDSALLVKTVGITDQFDNVTDLSFTAVRLGEPMGDDQFSFDVPDGVEVISATTN